MKVKFNNYYNYNICHKTEFIYGTLSYAEVGFLVFPTTFKTFLQNGNKHNFDPPKCLFLLAIMLYVLLRFVAFHYPFGFFKLFFALFFVRMNIPGMLDARNYKYTSLDI
jgi:hypothetical protein